MSCLGIFRFIHVDLECVSTRAFYLEQGLVCTVKDLLKVHFVFLNECGSYRQGEEIVLGIGHEQFIGLGKQFAYAEGEFGEALYIGQKDDEFIATESADSDIVTDESILQSVAQEFQNFITFKVAIIIIDLLEEIQVHNHHGAKVLLHNDILVEGLFHVVSVPKAGQGIRVKFNFLLTDGQFVTIHRMQAFLHYFVYKKTTHHHHQEFDGFTANDTDEPRNRFDICTQPRHIIGNLPVAKQQDQVGRATHRKKSTAPAIQEAGHWNEEVRQVDANVVYAHGIDGDKCSKEAHILDYIAFGNFFIKNRMPTCKSKCDQERLQTRGQRYIGKRAEQDSYGNGGTHKAAKPKNIPEEMVNSFFVVSEKILEVKIANIVHTFQV